MDLTEVNPDNANRHPWELSRRDSLLRVIDTLGPLGDVADVGAGDRFFARALQARATGRVYAIDSFYPHTGMVEGIQLERSAASIPDASLDCVVMMDVLEHVEQEGPLLRDVRRTLKPGGALLVTVPAYQRLFFAHDAFMKHFRRYNRRQLRRVLEAEGFAVTRTFHFYAALCAARLLQVAKERIAGPAPAKGAGAWPFGVNHPATVTVKTLLDWDYRVCAGLAALGVFVPGLSLCAVCRKTSA